MERGSVVLARYPYTNMVDYKIRPVIIISNKKFNEKHSYFLVCPITSKTTLQEYELELAKENFSGELKTQSFVRTDAVAAIEKDLLLKEIGTVKSNFLQKIIEKIGRNF